MPIRPTSLFLVLLASAACWSSLATQAAAADDRLEWQFFESNDPADKGRMTAGLIYGVPETDNVQVSGVCEAGSGSGVKTSSVVFGADIGDLQNGKDIELRFSGGGFDHALKGQIHRPAGEEGLSGIHVDIAHDDPLWRAMADKDSLDYLVPGYKAATLDLTRGKDRVEAFVQACRTYAGANAGQQAEGEAAAGGGNGAEKDAFDSAKELGTLEAWEAFLASYPSGFHADLARAYVKKLEPNPPPPQAAKTSTAAEPGPDPSCKQRSKLRSQNSDTPTSITFINKSGQYRGILWLDFDGQPKDYANLNSGERVTLSTFMTHPWMITDGPGNCIQIVMPRGGGRVVELGGAGGAKSGAAKRAKPVAKEAATSCPPGTKPVPETDNCVPVAGAKKKSAGCGKGRISIEGKCIRKQDAVSFCGPGFRLQGNKCVQGFAAPKTPPRSVHGCPPGMAWSAEEGYHEDD